MYVRKRKGISRLARLRLCIISSIKKTQKSGYHQRSASQKRQCSSWHADAHIYKKRKTVVTNHVLRHHCLIVRLCNPASRDHLCSRAMIRVHKHGPTSDSSSFSAPHPSHSSAASQSSNCVAAEVKVRDTDPNSYARHMSRRLDRYCIHYSSTRARSPQDRRNRLRRGWWVLVVVAV
jgi:hypothetical protein